jgi:putative transposase
MDRLVLTDVAWERMAPEATSDDPDFEYLIVDSTIVPGGSACRGGEKGGPEDQRLVARAAA